MLRHHAADLEALRLVLVLLALIGAGFAFWLGRVVAGAGLIVLAVVIALLL